MAMWEGDGWRKLSLVCLFFLSRFIWRCSGLVVLEGVHALNPALRKMLDLRVAVVGGVHYHLVKRCLDDGRSH